MRTFIYSVSLFTLALPLLAADESRTGSTITKQVITPQHVPIGQPRNQAVRGVYLNGQDISSARGQELKGVNILIDESGQIFISAPHYIVTEEETFTPLSTFAQGQNAPIHKQPQAMGSTSNPNALLPALARPPETESKPLAAKPDDGAEKEAAKDKAAGQPSQPASNSVPPAVK